jgi:hypothetical protein
VAAGTGKAGEEEVRLKRCRVAEDEVCAFIRSGERQSYDAIAEVGVGLCDGVLGALGLFPALAAFRVRGVDLRPPRGEEDWIPIAVVLPARIERRGACGR